MPLQKLTIQRINASFGLERVISVLDLVCKSCCVTERFYINNVIIYLRTLYIIKVDIVEDLIHFDAHARQVISLLNKKYQHHQLPELKLVIDIIEYNLDYASGIRKIS